MEQVKQKKELYPPAVWAFALSVMGLVHPLFGFIAIFFGVGANMKIKNNEHVMTGQVIATVAILGGIACIIWGNW